MGWHSCGPDRFCAPVVQTTVYDPHASDVKSGSGESKGESRVASTVDHPELLDVVAADLDHNGRADVLFVKLPYQVYRWGPPRHKPEAKAVESWEQLELVVKLKDGNELKNDQTDGSLMLGTHISESIEPEKRVAALNDEEINGSAHNYFHVLTKEFKAGRPIGHDGLSAVYAKYRPTPTKGGQNVEVRTAIDAPKLMRGDLVKTSRDTRIDTLSVRVFQANDNTAQMSEWTTTQVEALASREAAVLSVKQTSFERERVGFGGLRTHKTGEVEYTFKTARFSPADTIGVPLKKAATLPPSRPATP